MLPTSYCSDCGCKLEEVISIEEDDFETSPGDVSICFNCTAFLQFDNNLRLILLPSTKNLSAKISRMLFKARRTIHKIRMEKK